MQTLIILSPKLVEAHNNLKNAMDEYICKYGSNKEKLQYLANKYGF